MRQVLRVCGLVALMILAAVQTASACSYFRKKAAGVTEAAKAAAGDDSSSSEQGYFGPGAEGRRPPLLPEFFTTNFVEYTQTGQAEGWLPPYVDGIPPGPTRVGRGQTYYDSNKNAMIETRFDYCLDIFPTHPLPEWACSFHNVDGVSYMISWETEQSKVKPPEEFGACCKFADPWWPVPRDFLRTRVKSTFSGNVPWGDKTATWWTNWDVNAPAGPMRWAFNESTIVGDAIPQVYSTFTFPAMHGFVAQNFQDADTTNRPPANVWDLPPQCNNGKVKDCGFWGPDGQPCLPPHSGDKVCDRFKAGAKAKKAADEL